VGLRPQVIVTNAARMRRFEGLIKSWNDDRGFGFIEPVHGGQEIFVHVTSFSGQGDARPRVGQRVSFEVESNREGRKRAKSVQAVRAPRRARRAVASGSAQRGTAAYFAIPVFALGYFAAHLLWRIPPWVAFVYVGASLACAIAYAADKSAAQQGRWRIPEANLLLLGLAGGWPGAIVAQQVLRHKSSKASFQLAFWATAVLNVVAFIALASPRGRALLAG
jgi:uncharacterized membrane protein YsdA (DUF1294 family)/cold shock CspA family protein